MAKWDEEARASDTDPAEQPRAAPGGADEQGVRAMLDVARSEADEQREAAERFKGLAQRAQADFVNYKRRIEAEREAAGDTARAETMRAFLPLVDDLERALAHVPPALASQVWAQGFKLIERNLGSVFERLGVQRMGAVGEPFDPNIHEAVAYEEDPNQPEGHVSAVMRTGYRLGERIVRPAQVTVARAVVDHSAGQVGWRPHQGRPGFGNGGVDQADFRQPRGIDRVDS